MDVIRVLKAADAREFFSHPSQKRGVLDPAQLHDNGMEYWANGPVCGAVHASWWPGVWMVHYGVKPEAWGKLTGPAVELLEAFWERKNASLLTGWTLESNRAALAFAKRCGFRENGRFIVPEGTVIMQEWRPENGR